tara:strand:+ start:4070 stop:5311 length:1242 start_codon:yes stop_codon:yes gene_type:complete
MSLTSSKPFVAYDPKVAESLGNRTAASIYHKLLFWFSKYENGFYKFMEPCPHKLYRAGDSWTEEIGIARRTFTRAFDLIGVRYKSKALFQAENDPFKGKLFASYVDNDTNQTFYLKNPTFLENLLKEEDKTSSSRGEGQGRESKNVRCATDKMTDPYKENKITFKKELYPPKSPLPEEEKGKWEEKSKKDLEEKKDILSPKLSSQDRKQAEDLLEIWKKETEGKVKVPPLTTHFATKILEAFQKFFEKNMEKWRLFARLCATSKWLMGETKTSFKPWLIWILGEKVVSKILNRDYGVDETFSFKTPQEIAREQENLRKLLEPQVNPYQDQWLSFCKKLQQKLGDETFNSWVKGLTPVDLSKDRVVLSAPSRFMKEYVENTLISVFQDVLGEPQQIVITDSPSLRQKTGVIDWS